MTPSWAVAITHGMKKVTAPRIQKVKAAAPPATAVVALVMKKMIIKKVVVISSVPNMGGIVLTTYSSEGSVLCLLDCCVGTSYVAILSILRDSPLNASLCITLVFVPTK